MSNLHWVLTEWHSISASSSPVKMDGVLYQDLFTILDKMLKLPAVQAWTSSLDKMYSHLSDYENPHQVTAAQLPTSVLEYLYEAWRKEGYEGTIEFFTTLLFLYLEVIQYETLISKDPEGIPYLDHEDVYPSVLAVAKYLHWHDTYLQAHANRMNEIFGGANLHHRPSVSYWQYLGLPTFLVFDNSIGKYTEVVAFPDRTRAPEKFTIVACSRFSGQNELLFGLHESGNTLPIWGVYLNWAQKRVELKNKIGTIYAYVDLANYVANWGIDKSLDIPVALISDRHKLTIVVYVESSTYKIPAIWKMVNDREIPDGYKEPTDLRLLFGRMDRHDPLHQIVCYADALTDEMLISVMRHHQLQTPIT